MNTPLPTTLSSLSVSSWSRLALGGLWLGAILYSIFWAPPDQPGTGQLIQRLAIGNWQGINPLIVSLFNLMGVWPLLYAGILAIDGRGQRFPAWPFVVASFAVGAFALLPYLALRRPNPVVIGRLDKGLKLWEGRGTAVILLLLVLIFLGYGLVWGDWADFWQQWRSSRFIHVMTLDFCLLSLLFPLLLPDDWARRGMVDCPWRWWTVVPLLGALLYYLRRPPLILSENVYNDTKKSP